MDGIIADNNRPDKATKRNEPAAPLRGWTTRGRERFDRTPRYSCSPVRAMPLRGPRISFIFRANDDAAGGEGGQKPATPPISGAAQASRISQRTSPWSTGYCFGGGSASLPAISGWQADEEPSALSDGQLGHSCPARIGSGNNAPQDLELPQEA